MQNYELFYCTYSVYTQTFNISLARRDVTFSVNICNSLLNLITNFIYLTSSKSLMLKSENQTYLLYLNVVSNLSIATSSFKTTTERLKLQLLCHCSSFCLKDDTIFFIFVFTPFNELSLKIYRSIVNNQSHHIYNSLIVYSMFRYLSYHIILNQSRLVLSIVQSRHLSTIVLRQQLAHRPQVCFS